MTPQNTSTLEISDAAPTGEAAPTPTSSPPASPRAPEKPAWQDLVGFILAYRLDLLLGILSVVFFGLFARNSLLFQRQSGIGAPLATLVSGKGERKASGHTDFSPAPEGTKFFNLDAAWIPKGSSAKFVLDDGMTVSLAENTLVLFKKPFRKKQGGGALEDRLKVVTGKITTGTKNPSAMSKQNFPELPQAKDIALTEEQLKLLQPKPDIALYYRVPDNIEVLFAWPSLQSGFLVVRNEKDQRTSYYPITNQKSTKAFLPKNETPYAWQIIDSSKKVLSGPFHFQLHTLTPEVARALLQSPPKTPFEIHW